MNVNPIQRGILRQVTPLYVGVGHLQNHLVLPDQTRNFTDITKDTPHNWIVKARGKVSNVKPVLERLQKLFGIESAEQHKFAVSGTVSNVKRVRERLQNLFGIESAEEYKFAASGTIMCKAMVENINYDEFFRELDMPNTFNSWYRVTELHIWLLMVCAMAEKANGIYLRNQIVRALWKEVETKLERNYGMTYSILHQYNSLHYDYFTPSTIEYDDGLLSADDTMLANAIWRNFYDSNCDDIEKIELLVKYVRKTVCLLDDLHKPQSMCIKPREEWLISLKELKDID